MRSRKLIVCAVAASLAASVALAQEDRWASLIRQANAMEHAGRYAESAVYYQDALKIVEGSDDWRLPQTLNGLANAYGDLGR